MSTIQQPPVVAFTLAQAQVDEIVNQGIALAQADATFETAITDVATHVARVMGEKPSYALWTAVADVFQKNYMEERECKPETATKRWYAVAAAMEAQFALEKPAKPSKAAEVKAAQRGDAASEASALIAKAKATTPAAVLALSSQAGLSKPVIAALAKTAGALAADAGAAATALAKEQAKACREEIRKSLVSLNLEQLQKVRVLIGKLTAPVEMVPAQTPENEETQAPVGGDD